ncbi:MAG: transglutaminase domain-containing protein [Spirochaetales bacterium]|nr:transglutaminase domain-containing protein [Spirochaetales bacterium]
MIKYPRIIILIIISLGSVFPCSALSAYPDPGWKKIDGPHFAAPPVLIENEEIDNYYQGAVWSKGGFVHWIVFYAIDSYAILRWNMNTGAASRVLQTDSRIRSMAYDFKEDALVLRKSKTLEYYDNTTLKLIKTLSFEKLDNWWRDMTILDTTIVTIERETHQLGIFDKVTGEKIKTMDTGKEKVQRLFRGENEQVWLWSSYWGTRLYLFDLKTGKIQKETRTTVPHRNFFMAKMMGNNILGVFNPVNNTFDVLMQEGGMWINTAGGYEMLGDHLGFRFSPLKEEVTGEILIDKPTETLPSGDVITLLPQNTYGQILENGSNLLKGSLLTDEPGNTYLRITLPEIKKGESYKKAFYRGALTRWYVYFNLEKLPRKNKINTPQLLQLYLEDDDRICLTDKQVVKVYEDRFETISSLPQRVEAIYNFARDEMEKVWDGKTDKVPGILENMHGGCTEHSYVQIAMLRLSGLPARFNWNAFPDPESKDISFNHKHAEVWFPESGWIPLEPLGARLMAGSAADYHFIFAVHVHLGNPYFDRYDRVAAYAGNDKWEKWEIAPIIITWKRKEM